MDITQARKRLLLAVYVTTIYCTFVMIMDIENLTSDILCFVEGLFVCEYVRYCESVSGDTYPLQTI